MTVSEQDILKQLLNYYGYTNLDEVNDFKAIVSEWLQQKQKDSGWKKRVKSPIRLFVNGSIIELKFDGNKRYVGTDGTTQFTIFGVDLELLLLEDLDK